MSIGQEVSVTALQMVAAFGAVANGGTLVQPRPVRSIFEADGREVRRFEPVAVRQVISKETAQTLTRILVRVVEAGTGHNAAIAGYDVAGKTGTAQKLDPATRRYSRAPGVLSFVGFAPADAPRVVLRYLDVPPRDVKAVQIEATPAADRTRASGPAGIRAAATAAAEPADGI